MCGALSKRLPTSRCNHILRLLLIDLEATTAVRIHILDNVRILLPSEGVFLINTMASIASWTEPGLANSTYANTLMSHPKSSQYKFVNGCFKPTLTNRWATIDGNVDNVTHVIEEFMDLRIRSICREIGDEDRASVDVVIVQVGFGSEAAPRNSRLSRLKGRRVTLTNLGLKVPFIRVT